MTDVQKTVNYDETTVQKMVEVYTAADTQEARDAAMLEIQAFTGKSIPSIRSKLGQLKVYVPKAKAAKKGRGVTKAEMVSLVADAAPEKADGFFDSLESANANVIQFVLDLQSDIAALEAEIEGDIETVESESETDETGSE